MRLLNSLLIVTLFAGCSRKTELPEGVSLRVPSGNVILTLDDNNAVQIRQNKPDSRIALVGNVDGKLNIVQLEQGGDTPRSMDLISRNKAQFSVTTGSGQSLVKEIGVRRHILTGILHLEVI